MAEPGDPDLTELLEADHRRMHASLGAGGASSKLIREVSSHIVAEHQLLYPAVRHRMADGNTVVDNLIAIDHELERSLAEVDRDRSRPTSGVAALLVRHVEEQERLFVELRRVVDADELRRLGQALGPTLMQAPTHPHPHLPEEGPLEVIADAVASSVDHVRDAMGRVDEEE